MEEKRLIFSNNGNCSNRNTVFHLLFCFILLVKMIQIKPIFHENLDFCIDIDFHTHYDISAYIWKALSEPQSLFFLCMSGYFCPHWILHFKFKKTDFVKDFVSRTCHNDLSTELILHIAQVTRGLHTCVLPSIYKKSCFQ